MQTLPPTEPLVSDVGRSDVMTLSLDQELQGQYDEQYSGQDSRPGWSPPPRKRSREDEVDAQFAGRELTEINEVLDEIEQGHDGAALSLGRKMVESRREFRAKYGV